MIMKTFKLYKEQPLLCILIYFSLVGFVLSFFTNTLPDEELYIHEARIIYDCLSNYQWFGNEAVGMHGFLFKLPLSILYFITGPSYLVAQFYNIFLSLISIVLLYRISQYIFKEKLWASLSVLLFFSSYQFMKVFATFTREVPSLLALFLLFYFIFKKKNPWVYGIAYLLVFDAKEYVAIILALPLFIWIIVDSIKFHRDIFTKKLFNITYRIFAIFFPVLIYLCLMLFTSVIPYNSYTSKILMLENNNTFSSSFGFGARTVPFVRTKENWNKINEKRISIIKYDSTLHAIRKNRRNDEADHQKNKEEDSFQYSFKENEIIDYQFSYEHDDSDNRIYSAINQFVNSITPDKRIEIKDQENENLNEDKPFEKAVPKSKNNTISKYKNIKFKEKREVTIKKQNEVRKIQKDSNLLREKQFDDKIDSEITSRNTTQDSLSKLKELQVIDNTIAKKKPIQDSLSKSKEKVTKTNNQNSYNNLKADKKKVEPNKRKKYSKKDVKTEDSLVIISEFNKISAEKTKQEQFIATKKDNEENTLHNYLRYHTVNATNWVLRYINKVFSPRFLDYTSFPLYLLIFVFALLIKRYKKWSRSNSFIVLLLYFTFFYLIVYLLRDSFSRYLIHLMPVLSIFFIMYLKESYIKTTFSFTSFIVAFLFMIIQFQFDYFIPSITISLGLVFYIMLILIGLPILKNELRKVLIVALIVSMSLFSSLLRVGGDVLYGTIKQTLKYGFNSEYYEIGQFFKNGDKYLFNGSYNKLLFYTGERSNSLRIDQLNPIFPKRHLVNRYDTITYNFKINTLESEKDIDILIKKLQEKSISKIMFLEHGTLESTYNMTENLTVLLNQEWINNSKVIDFYNKRLYVLDVNLKLIQ